MIFIPSLGPGNLLCPKSGIGSRDLEEMAVVPVPEATIHENHCVILRENEIWLPGQMLAMEPVSKPKLVADLPYLYLRLCV